MSSNAPRQRSLLRPKDGRVLFGVCAGLARWLQTDAAVVRGAFAAPFALGLVALGASLCCCRLCSSCGVCWLRTALIALAALALALYALGALAIADE